MSARIVVVHDDPEFIERTVTALLAVGHEVTMFSDSMSATGALRSSQRIEVLITRIVFGVGQPHGVALARIARVNRPGVRVLFVAHPEFLADTEGVGEFLPMWAATADIVATVDRMLGEEHGVNASQWQPVRSRDAGIA
jgi:DNA-binding NtrC family response regulator